MMDGFHHRIFTYVKILIDIVCWNVLGEDAHDGGYLLVSTKSYELGRIPLALEEVYFSHMYQQSC
jgi:hypothetical protein